MEGSLVAVKDEYIFRASSGSYPFLLSLLLVWEMVTGSTAAAAAAVAAVEK